MMLRFLYVTFLLLYTIFDTEAYYEVNIHHQLLSQGGRTHFERDRWDGHNGLDNSQFLGKCKSIGTESGRWQNRDLNGHIFQNTPQDPHRHGYPDPNHFKEPHFVKDICAKYMTNINSYGLNQDMVMVLKDLYWPSWMDTSHHGGKFPNNLEAAAEFVVLLLETINQCSSGNMPAYLEVFNEPDAAWKYISWDTVVEYHHVVSQKVKSRFPRMKVGGACQNGIVNVADRENYKVWNFSKQFLDMSLDHLDFFSFHPYNFLEVYGNGSHTFTGINEARLVAYIDMVENYAHLKKGHSVPLLITEYGLSEVKGVDTNRPNTLIDWAYVYQHNAHMFTYLGLRDVIDRAIGFLLAYETYLGEQSLHYSFFYSNGSFRHAAKAYQFWRHFSYNQVFLRVDSEFNNVERTIPPLAMVDTHNGDIIVLLHNYKPSYQNVKINFENNWISSSSAYSTCLYLDSSNTPVLSENNHQQLSNHMVTLRPETSCFFLFHASANSISIPTVLETTYYGNIVAMNIPRRCAICILACEGCHYAVQTTINVHARGHIQYGRLRIGVSVQNSQGSHAKPKYVLLNNNNIGSYYQLYEPGRGHESTIWEVYVYNIPVNLIRQGNNELKVEFNRNWGSVSSIAMILGRM